MTYEDYLKSIYYDPNHAGSYGGLESYIEPFERKENTS